MKIYYIGDNDYEYGLSYGDEVEIYPEEFNNMDIDYFNAIINQGNRYVNVIEPMKWFLENFTIHKNEVDSFEIPKKPWNDNGDLVCPSCMEVVTDGFSECENCGQALDWN